MYGPAAQTVCPSGTFRFLFPPRLPHSVHEERGRELLWSKQTWNIGIGTARKGLGLATGFSGNWPLRKLSEGGVRRNEQEVSRSMDEQDAEKMTDVAREQSQAEQTLADDS
jgi:hypothetical protein